MASSHGTLPRANKQQVPALVGRLQRLFDRLPDNDLLQALQGPHRRGRKGYSVKSLWHSWLASYVLGFPSAAALVRALKDNPYLAQACGFVNPWLVPSEATYSRFVDKLVSHQVLVDDCLASVVNAIKETSPSFGETVAVDATDVKAWSNGMKKTDKDARTGAKHKASRRYWWFGYKLHLAVDADTDLPIWAVVTPANAYDGHHLPTVLNAAKERFPWFKPTYVLADKGYDSAEGFRYVAEELGATPVIDVRSFGSKKGSDDRPCEAEPVITPSGVRYRCQRVPYSQSCPRFGKCPLLPVFVDSPLNLTEPRYSDKYTNLAYGSKAWKTVYRKRVAAERAFSRLKGQMRLEWLKHRGLRKVQLHATLAILAYTARRALYQGQTA